ncbi:MAG: L-aspartate oxidase [Spirochaetota bacterium]
MSPFQAFSLPRSSASSVGANSPDRIVIVGAGLAGLFAALKLNELCPHPIVLLSPVKLGQGNASSWAQGGIAAAVGPDDSVLSHVEDTLVAGAGLSDPEVVRTICQAAVSHIAQLDAYGVPFDRASSDSYALSHEAAHSAKRVVRCVGDSSGPMIMKSLIAAVKREPRITVIEGAEAYRLLQNRNDQGKNASKGRVCGVVYRKLNEQKHYQLEAGVVILACGGIGALFEGTTNPLRSQGQGLGMAALAGAVLADSEFVQFHPTALDLPRRPQPLISETLRGEGATLLDANGQRFLLNDSEANGRAELAPRHVVSRAVFRARRNSGGAFLDCRHLCRDSTEFSQRFPTLWGITKLHKLTPTKDLLPVIPAAHYHMGGIATDLRGRSSVPGLWAIGELACTGFHGANRLASNSLLEAVVMGGRAAEDIAAHFQASGIPASSRLPVPIASSDGEEETQTFACQSLMSQYVGVERSTEGLIRALQELKPQSNALVAALAVGCAALLRRESRGSHYYLGVYSPTEKPEKSRFRLSNELEALLNQYNCNGKRSFLDWQDICRILDEVYRQQ